MNWIAGIANKHTLLAHLPLAAVLLIPVPIMAALRGGRGIRPWWVTCRYLCWAGALCTLAAVLSGLLLGWSHGSGLLGPLRGHADPGLSDVFRLHQAGGLASLLLALACLRSVYRHRLEHQGIGLKPLLLSLLWCGCILGAFYSGNLLTAPPPDNPVPGSPQPGLTASPAALGFGARRGSAAAQDPEASAPLRALDFASLKAMHPEPVKSAAHGNRWIRVWLTPASAADYQAGRPLAKGSLAVLSTVEDHWGRPGYELGPLYAMEIKEDGTPKFTFYWPQVPVTRRGETQGAERVYRRDGDPGLQACATCHGHGSAAKQDRSRFTPLRKPAAVPAMTAGGPPASL